MKSETHSPDLAEIQGKTAEFTRHSRMGQFIDPLLLLLWRKRSKHEIRSLV